MKIIAHRGNTTGPKYSSENNPYYLYHAITCGFDVEIDVWAIGNDLYLGHDKPEFLIDENFLIFAAPMAWFHCKNFEALNFFNATMPHLNYFWHDEDDYTITSAGYIWTKPGALAGENSIIVLPERIFSMDDMVEEVKKISPYAVCTDYPESFRQI